MRKSKTVLGDICKITMGQSPDSSTYNTTNIGLPFYQGNADFGELYPKTRIWCSEPQKIAEPENILLSVRAPIGALNIAKEKCCIGRGLAAITPHKNFCFNKYLFYILKYKHNELNARGTGSTFKAINKSILNDLPIDIYSIDRQKRIAAILDKATELIALRKQQIEQLDLLVKSRFIEMFGEPTSNTMGWNKYPLGKRCKILTGNTPSRSESENYGSFIEWIKSDNINTPNIYLTTAQEYLSEKGFKKCRYVEAGSILMTCIAGSIGCIGNVAVANRRVSFNQQINAIIPNKDETLYIYCLMQLAKKYIQDTVNISLKGILNKGKLSTLEFPFPPQSIQKDFVSFVKRVDKTKSTLQQSLEKLELNYKALMQTYFG